MLDKLLLFNSVYRFIESGIVEATQEDQFNCSSVDSFERETTACPGA